MDIQLEKKALIKMIEETNDSTIIASIKKIFKTEKKDWWDELNNQQKFEIEESDREIDRGEYVNFEDFIKKYI
ncbi:hypothetical protein [Flavobacterium sp.]|uniref:hypothetical protein n=1 Tax=Flavobacterium sp. TaxID=239 RepID=UPI00286DDA87|nr:hypothetical protein [Flavobacterium sp.]